MSLFWLEELNNAGKELTGESKWDGDEGSLEGRGGGITVSAKVSPTKTW